MEPVGVKRKLTVILAADVEGYSRLMGADEEATHKTLRAYRDIIDGLIARHDGRIFSTAGDSVVAEFASPVEAVRSAISIQEELRVRNTEQPEDRQMRFRIGINLGDVIVDGDDIYGDGVNVAARLEGLAEPGGVCISGDVYNQIENKLALGYDDLGRQEVKNITKPVQAFRVVPGPVSGTGAAKPATKPSVATRWRIPVIAVTVTIVVAVGGVAIWEDYLRPAPSPPVVARKQGPALASPDKPSIAVLPFENLSGDPKQDYFSDGITEDIITDLSKISGLSVVSRKAAFRYKGKDVKPEQVSQELGVRYVVEGSVRKAGGRVRINAQLIDATTGHYLWAERYDRDLKDVLVLQDEIAEKIVAAFDVRFTKGEQESKSAPRGETYEYFLQGGETYLLRTTKEANAQARRKFARDIELDPTDAGAHIALAVTYFLEWQWQWSSKSEALDRALDLAQRAVVLDDSLGRAHSWLGWIYLWKGRHDEAIAEFRRATSLDPNHANGYAFRGEVLNFAGQPEEAIALAKKALLLNPHYPVFRRATHYPADYSFVLGHAYYLTGRYEEAIAAMNSALARTSDFLPAHRGLAIIYSELGQVVEAKAAVAEVLRINPRASLELWRHRLPYKDQATLEQVLDGLRKAGIPEKSKS